MKLNDLGEEMAIELELIETTVQELLALQHDVAGRELTTREKTAAAAFLAQFYNGVENIFKRLSYYHSMPLPTGDNWHVELFTRFCSPLQESLPILLDEPLAVALAPFRKFRHVFYHGYTIQLDWSRMAEGVDRIENVFLRFKSRLADYLNELESNEQDTLSTPSSKSD